MQLYALDQLNQPVLAGQASKHQDYICSECRERVRVRGGMHRQPHFYHLEPNRHCHLSGKTMPHLQTQWAIYQALPEGECQLEFRLPEINRIADVAWHSQRIIFEVQCSLISAEEILKRNADYRSLNWEVVWILHDKRYNQWRLTAAEWVLRTSSHYFTNMNGEGRGIIYDQFDQRQHGIRLIKLNALPIDVNRFKRFSSLNLLIKPVGLIQLTQQRLNTWKLFFEGDLVLSNLNKQELAYLKMVHDLEAAYNKPARKSRLIKIKEALYRYFIRPYQLLFQILLEKACR